MRPAKGVIVGLVALRTALFALLEDNGDGVGHQSAEGGDGAIARVTYLDSLVTIQVLLDTWAIGEQVTRDRVACPDSHFGG